MRQQVEADDGVCRQVDRFGDGGERTVQYALAEAVHFRIVQTGVFILLVNRGAGEDVVELVDQEQVPCLQQVAAENVFLRQTGNRRGHFGARQQEFAAAVVLLDKAEACIGAAVVFKIHFVVPDGQLVVNGFRGMEEFVRMAHAGCGEPRNLRKTPGVFKHAVGCAAAAVAVAEHIHDGIRHAFFRVPIPDAGQMRGVVFAAVTAALQIAEHFAAVCAAPAENGVGEAVRVVAVDFVRDEIFHAAAPDDLRERPGKAEAVGQPVDVGGDAELFLEKFMPS